MPTFGFSAYLKLLSLPSRPQRTELRNRLLPSSGSGYDFHRRFRHLAHRYLSNGELLESLMLEAAGWGGPAEGRAAADALEFLEEWREQTSGRLLAFPSKIWTSPEGLFKVKFTPDFGIEIDGVSVAVHIWKTKRPPLDARMTYTALALFTDQYGSEVGAPQDLAVLSLLDGRLYRLSDVPDQSLLASRVAAVIENIIEQIGDDGGPPLPPSGDRPSTPG